MPRGERRGGGIGSRLGLGRLDGEACAFVLLLAAVVLQVIVEGAGRAGLGLLEVPLALVLAPALVVGFVLGGRAVRTLLAGALGLASLSVGLAVYAPRLAVSGVGGSSYTGVVAMLAGVGLALLAFRVALHSRCRRVKLLAVPAAFVIVHWLLIPAINAGLVTNAPHATVAAARTLGLAGARDVSFTASDGVRLRGWYVPGRNGAAVILLHGSHGDRSDTRPHLRLLSRLGYGVLAYDARGHGQSGGTTNALGWNSDRDLRGAIAFLDHQPGVDPGRIAALGLSMGAEEALRAAADGLPLHAVIADGAGASTLGDTQLLEHGPTAPIANSTTWLAMRTTEALTAEREPAPLKSIVTRIHVPVLLIASKRAGELEIDRAYQQQMGNHATLWHLADANHTQALQQHPAAYRARLRAFLVAAIS